MNWIEEPNVDGIHDVIAQQRAADDAIDDKHNVIPSNHISDQRWIKLVGGRPWAQSGWKP